MKSLWLLVALATFALASQKDANAEAQKNETAATKTATTTPTPKIVQHLTTAIAAAEVTGPKDAQKVPVRKWCTREFTWDVQRKLGENGSFVWSPFSVIYALANMYLGSAGETSEEIEELLCIPHDTAKDDFHQAVGEWRRAVLNESSVNVSLASTIFIQSDFGSHLEKNFTKDMNKYYDSNVNEVDFINEAPNVTRLINAWVSQNTHDKIKDLVEEDDVQKAFIVYINAIYFSGHWKYLFPVNATTEGPFHTSGGKALDVPYMKLNAVLPYASNRYAEVIKLPYDEERYSFVVILPNASYSLDNWKEEVDATAIGKMIAAVRGRHLVLSMPKFTVGEKFELGEVFDSLDYKKVLGSGSNYANMLREGKGFDEMIHEAKMEVDEKGTVAAAATAAIGTRIADLTFPVNVDRAFLFFIIEEATGEILFSGQYDGD